MTVYADILVIVNLYVDFLLLYWVQAYLRLKTRGGRLVLGALAGSLSSLLGLLPWPGWVGPLLGGACAMAAAGAAFAPVKTRLFLRCWLCTWLFSFLLAGFVLFVMQFAPPGYMTLVGGAVYLDLSLPVLFFATCLAYLVLWGIRRLFPRENPAPLCGLTVFHQGRSARIFAKADTGNALREPFSGLPVVVCQAAVLKDLAPAPALAFLAGQALAGREEAPERGSGEGFRLVPFESVGGRGLLPAFKPEKVTQSKTGRELDCYIALTQTPLSSGQFAALYNPDLFLDE